MDDFGFDYDTGVCKAFNDNDICTDGLTNNSFQFPLVPGHSYRWWVHAINSCNNWSTAASVDVTVPGPTATPTVPTVTVVDPSPTPTRTTSVTPTGTESCLTHSKGDANCDGQVDFIDFEIWRQETMDEVTTKNADFNGDTVIDFIDFEIWRQGYFDESPYPTAVEVTVPGPTCAIRPACTDANNQCADLTPPALGWCPISVTPTPTAVGQDATITPTPSL